MKSRRCDDVSRWESEAARIMREHWDEQEGPTTAQRLALEVVRLRLALRQRGCRRRDDGYVLDACYAGGVCPMLVGGVCTAFPEEEQ